MNTVQTIAISAFILAGGVIGLVVLGQKPEVPTQAVSTIDTGVEVVTARVAEWNQPFDIKVDGEAATYRIVTVGAEVAGRIISKAETTRSGTFIRKGDLLFEIDPTKYLLEIDRLEAEMAQIDEELKGVEVDVQSTSAMIKLTEEDVALQEKQLARMKTLLARRTANDTEVETAMKQELLARNALQTQRNQQNTLAQQRSTKLAGKKLVQTQLERADVDLKRCKVVSPLDGRIVDDAVEEGDYIKEGELLVHISDSARMEIKTKLRAEELAWVWQQHAVINKASGKTEVSQDPLNLPKIPCEVGYVFEGVETIWDGYVARIEGTGLDRDTRTFPCRILVEEPRKTRFNDSSGGHATVSPPTLLSGMFVNVRIPVESPLQLLRVPMEAIRPGGQIWVDRDGMLDILAVNLANVQGQDALIRQDGSGLQPDDRVVVSPLTSVREGMKLREAGTVVEQPKDLIDTASAAEAAK